MKRILSILLSIIFSLSCVFIINAASDEIDPELYRVTASSHNAPGGVSREIPELALDGNLKSHWHSSIEPKAEGPHFITIEFPDITDVGGYRYYPREGGGAGICTEYAIYLSLDDEMYQKVAEGKWENNIEAKTVKFPYNYKTKLVRLEIISATAGYASAGEIRALTPNKNARTLDVAGDVKRESLAKVFKIEEDVTIDNDYGDEIGIEGWTFDTSSTNANNGKPAEVPERVIDGNLESHWHTMINPKAEAPHYITVILPKEEVISGYRYYPRLKSPAGICTRYEIHISPDGENFEKISEGTWKNNTEAKAVKFGMNILVKAVKLVILEGYGGYGSAGEIRLIGEDAAKKTITAAEFLSENESFNMVLVPHERITVKSDQGYSSPLTYMIDDLEVTHYHSIINATILPITFDFDLGHPSKISGFSYGPRTDTNLTGHFKKFDILYSNDGENYVHLETVTFPKIDNAKKDVLFKEKIEARYIRIVVTEGQGNYATCSEFKFLQSEKDQNEEEKKYYTEYVLKIGSEEIKVHKNEKDYSVMCDVAPFIYKGSTMIPLRGLLEQMGSEVNWIDYNQKIEVITDRRDLMVFSIEDDRVYINDIRFNAPVAPMIADGRTFIPLRFLSENMGYNVKWNGETQEITITNK